MREKLHQFLDRLHRDERGLAFLELAFSVPILVVLLLGGIEISRYVFVHQKLERAAVTMADLISQSYSISQADLQNMQEASSYVMNPFDMAANGFMIASSIASDDGASATIKWQRTLGGVDGGAGGSRYGSQGGSAALPPDFVVRADDSVIAAEAFYTYEPLFFDFLLSARTLQSTALFRPRFAALTELE